MTEKQQLTQLVKALQEIALNTEDNNLTHVQACHKIAYIHIVAMQALTAVAMPPRPEPVKELTQQELDNALMEGISCYFANEDGTDVVEVTGRFSNRYPEYYVRSLINGEQGVGDLNDMDFLGYDMPYDALERVVKGGQA